MDWKIKLKAILHDPPHKQWVMFSEEEKKIRIDGAIHQNHQWHEKVAEHLLNYLIYGECIKEWKIDDADKIASALSRIIVTPNIQGQIREEYEKTSSVDWSETKFIDIFSQTIKDLEVPVSQEIEKLFNKISGLKFLDEEKEAERAKFFFFFFWRFYLEVFSWIDTHPADSRAPNHSMYDHLVQTSAIASALPQPAFLLFTISPVQDFISKSRKTQDLWSGSYMLSYLVWESMKPLIDKFGPDVIVSPNLFSQPLMDNYLANLKFDNDTFKSKLKDFQNQSWFKKFLDGAYDKEKITVANFPNRFLAIVPFENNLAKECEDAFKNKIDELSEEVFKKIRDTLTNHTVNSIIRDEIKKHLFFYFRTYWVVLPWIFSTENYSPNDILDDYKSLVGKTKLYKTIEIIINHPYYQPPNVGYAYSLALELTEKLLGARKSVRNFEPLEEEGEKCTLCGEFNQLNINWEKLIPIVRRGEKLCGVCMTKRLFPEIINKRLVLIKGTGSIKFPSTSEMASIGEKRRLTREIKEKFRERFERFKQAIESKPENKNKKLPETTSVFALKEDPLYKIDGQFLMKNTFREDYFKREYGLKVCENDFKELLDFIKVEDIKPSTYYALLQMDGDNMGKWLKGEFNPKIGEVIHQKAKNALIAYSKGKDKEELQKLLCSPHPNSPSIHQAFSRKLSNFALDNVKNIVENNHYGKLIYAGGDDVLALLSIEEVLDCANNLQKTFKEVLSPKSSMSAGILLVHHKYPLYLAIKEVNQVEKRAKNYFKKDAFCIRLLTHSGGTRDTGGKWDLVSFVNKLICKFRNNELSSRFPYEFLELVENILGYEEGEDGKIEKNDKVYEIVKNELTRIYERKTEDKEFLRRIIDLYENYEFAYKDFANIFIIAEFLSKEFRI